MSGAPNAGRRRFLAVSLSASGALLVGLRLAHADPAPDDLPAQLLGDDLTQLGPFVRIERDNRIVIGAPGCEIGQGVITSQPMLIAEELDVAWNQVRVVQLPYGYSDSADGPSNRYGDQGDAGSAPAEVWKHLREAGATARWLLVAAAAREWKLPTAQLRTEAGEVIAPDGRKLSYGALARSAAAIAPPATPVEMKTADQFRIIGKPTRDRRRAARSCADAPASAATNKRGRAGRGDRTLSISGRRAGHVRRQRHAQVAGAGT